MSIVIKLYSFNKKENSTLAPASNVGTSFDCLIKTPSSMLTPVVELHSLTNPSLYNYAYIPDFYRYYYITDWTFDRGLWYASLRVDVLATFRTSIGAQSMYILRSSQQKDGYVKDTMFPLTGRVTCNSDVFDTQTGIGYKDGYFVISTVGQTNNAGQTIYQMNATQFNQVMTQLLANASGSVSWGGIVDGIKNSLLNPTDYIVSAYWFPSAFQTVQNGDQEFKCGLWASGVNVPVLDNSQPWLTYTVNVPKHPQASTRGAYLNASPFTKYEVDLGFMGSFEVDTTKLIDASSFTIYIAPDPLTGIAKVEGRVGSSPYQQLFNITCNYGVPINIAMGKNNILNSLTDIARIGVQTMAGNIEGAMVGTVAGIGDFADSLVGTVSNSGAVGTINGHSRSKRLYSRFFEVVANDNDHLGSPLCQVTTPNALSGGYILAEDCDIAISWATQPEIDQIKRYATTGFFYEL